MIGNDRGKHRTGGHARRGRARRQSLRVVIEPLEERSLLATLSVGPNINISMRQGNQSEQAVAINPTNPNNVVAMSNDVTGVGGLLYFAYSMDDGHTWTGKNLSDDLGLPGNLGDPSLAFDTFGNLFISGIDGTDSGAQIYKSTDGGQTVTSLADVILPGGGTADQPKIRTGPGATPGSQTVWIVCANYQGNSEALDVTGAATTGLGQFGTFSAWTAVPGSDNMNYGDMSVGPQGQVAVSMTQNASGAPVGLYVSTNLNGLNSPNFTTASLVTMTNVDAYYLTPPQPLGYGIDAEPKVAYDKSSGPHSGRLYMSYSDAPSYGSTATRTYVVNSDNNGTTWSARSKVDDDTSTNAKILPAIAVDPVSGTVAVTWIDSRNDPAGVKAQTYATASIDGGQTWLPNVAVSKYLSDASNDGGVPPGFRDIQYGDYSGVAIYNNEIQSAFADNSTGLGGNPSLPNFDLATAAVSVIQLVITPQPISLQESTPFTGTVATFNPFDSTATAGDFTSTVDWGDGTTSPGVITANGDGTFSVSTTKTYAEGGTFATKVYVTDVKHSSTMFAAGQVVVADLPITVLGTTINQDALGNPIKEGYTFTGAVASFTDGDPLPQGADHYTAQIAWGDDGTTSPGTVVPIAPGQFAINATHVFGGGTSPIHVTITDNGGGTGSANSTAVVIDSILTAAQNFSFSPLEGTPYSGAVASFTDADPRQPPPSNYFASVIVTDPTTGAVLLQTPGVIARNPSGPGYIVTAPASNFVFDANVKPYGVEVDIGNRGGNTAVAHSQALVSDAPLIGSGFTYQVVEGQKLSNFLAQFLDTDPRLQPVSHYSAQINWGDQPTQGKPGTTNGTVVVNTDGGYLVKGTYAYANAGTYTYDVKLTELVGGGTLDITGQVKVSLAPLGLQMVATASPVEGSSLTDVVVATFSTPNTLAQPTDYTATINWGDGSSTAGSIRHAANGPGFEIVGGNKTYSHVGTYPIIVTLSRNYVVSDPVTASGQIVVQDAPLTATTKPLVLVSKTDLTGLTVAHFTDADPLGTLSEFSATINWGDGTAAAPGKVVLGGFSGFDVKADHRFAKSGSYTAQVVISSINGASTTVATAISVSPQLFPISAQLAPGSVSPVVAYATGSSTPTFVGSAEPGATVSLFAIPATGVTSQLLGKAKANATGAWSLTASTLADGSYALSASAIDANGDPSSPLTPIALASHSLVVDTQGPQVHQVNINPRTGVLSVTFIDSGSGLNPSSLSQAGNYTLSIQGPRGAQTVHTSQISLSPAGVSGNASVTLRFTGLSRFQAGTYVLQMNSSGLTDVAGNALDERFYIPFPGLYTTKGQNFIAQFTSDGTSASALKQYVPPPEVIAAQKHAKYLTSQFSVRRR